MKSAETVAATSDWQAYYRRRLVSPDEAVSQVRSNDHIWLAMGQQVAQLLTALAARAGELEGVRISGAVGGDLGWFNDEFQRHIGTNVFFASFVSREAVNTGVSDYTPWWVFGAQKAADEHRPGARPVDVSFINVTPPNQHGYCCLGNWLWDAKTTARRARLVIAELNDHLPQTFGDTWMHVSEIDWFVENHHELPDHTFLYPPPEPQDRPIGEYVASLINHRDTLQIGTGQVTGKIPRMGALDDKEDLGFFSELTIPGCVDLVKKGVITSKYLATHPGKFVTTTAGNTQADLDFIDENPMFEFYSVDYMHNPAMIARNDNMVAINSALAVDLTGQIAAGSIGPRIHSGTGGQLAYVLGAFMSSGGRSICVLPSTALGGTQSRIVVQFEAGQHVTIPRELADIVVTQHGIAHLLNKTQRERMEAMIAVAHPDFRSELRRQAAQLR